jgi:FMN phosphatase YigB (HAD superfamily)
MRALSEEVAPLIEVDKFIKALLLATQNMISNRLPDCTLQEVFNNAFFSDLEVNPNEFKVLADKFYSGKYKELKQITNPIPEAVMMVNNAVENGYRLAIVTNPLFPEYAVKQRLSWAGLSSDHYNYELVASYEKFHFAKPNPSFYAEVLAQMNWPEGIIVMVGDDFANDIQVTHKMGMPAFWVGNGVKPKIDGSEVPFGWGEIDGLLPWIEEFSHEDLEPEFKSITAMLAILRSTPAFFDSLSRSYDRDILKIRPKAGEWCIVEILCHLKDVDAEVNLPRLNKVLEEQDPFLPGKDTDPWAETRQYICQDWSESLNKFIATRVKILDLLESIRESDWQRNARHAIIGHTYLGELVNIIASHDRLHIKQIHQILQTIT